MKPFEVQRRAAAHYAKVAQEILRCRANDWAIDPYSWDHDGGLWLSPIETTLWHDLRLADIVAYPQWPVGRFFVDFANPVAKVAIECDGKAFHDVERDAKRQGEIEAMGWAVYRFTGRECNVESVIETSDDWGRISRRESPTLTRIREIGVRHGICWGACAV